MSRLLPILLVPIAIAYGLLIVVIVAPFYIVERFRDVAQKRGR